MDTYMDTYMDIYMGYNSVSNKGIDFSGVNSNAPINVFLVRGGGG